MLFEEEIVIMLSEKQTWSFFRLAQIETFIFI